MNHFSFFYLFFFCNENKRPKKKQSFRSIFQHKREGTE